MKLIVFLAILTGATALELSTTPVSLRLIFSEEYFTILTNCAEGRTDFDNDYFYSLVKPTAYRVVISGQHFRGYKYFKDLPEAQEILPTLKSNVLEILKGKHQLNFSLEEEAQIQLERVDSKLVVRGIRTQYQQMTPQIGQDDYQYEQLHSPHTQRGWYRRRLLGSGAHQKINITIQLSAEMAATVAAQHCTLQIAEVLPESTYIDSDEIRGVISQETINIEKPTLDAKQYLYRRKIPMSNLRELSLVYPIHFRYPPAGNNSYAYIALHGLDRLQIVCGEKVLDLREKAQWERGGAKIPCGIRGESTKVGLISFVSLLLCSLLLIKQLRKFQ